MAEMRKCAMREGISAGDILSRDPKNHKKINLVI